MITKKDILKMVKHVTRRSKQLPDRRIIHPRREWALGVIVFFVLLTIGGVLSASRFIYYSGIDSQLEDNDVFVVEYKSGLMKTTLSFFDEQTLRFQQIRNGIVPVTPAPVIEEETEAEEEFEATEEVAVEEFIDEVVEVESATEADDSGSGGLDIE